MFISSASVASYYWVRVRHWAVCLLVALAPSLRAFQTSFFCQPLWTCPLLQPVATLSFQLPASRARMLCVLKWFSLRKSMTLGWLSQNGLIPHNNIVETNNRRSWFRIQLVLQIRQRKIFEKLGQIRQPIALFANSAISSQIRRTLARNQIFWAEIDPFKNCLIWSTHYKGISPYLTLSGDSLVN